MKILDRRVVSTEMEEHFKVDINGKEVCISVYAKSDNFDTDFDIEIFKGEELLDEDEQEMVIEFVSEKY